MKTVLMTTMVFFLFACQTNRLKVPEQVTIAHRTNPTKGSSESIGYYSLGCLKGARTFQGNEKGLVLSQSRRGRFWGHSQLIDLLVELGEFSHQRFKRSVILGDLSLSRGGPTFGGHSSHQNGLDVDIWFEMVKKAPDFRFIQTAEMKTVLDKDGFNKDFDKKQVMILNFLGQDERVDRIFVHPKIKKFLCEKKKEDFDTETLRKIRPWYGHDDHLHLRLKCLPRDKNCQSQKPPPEGDGCDALAWWESDEAKKEMKERVYTFESQKKDYIDKVSNLPKACQEIYKDAML